MIVLGAGGWWWYSSSSSDQSGQDQFVRTAVVERGDLVVSTSASGLIQPIEQVEVKSKASGEIITLPIEEGDVVSKGDLIARLDRRTAQNDYDQAKADFAVAQVTVEQQKKEMERQKSLFEKSLTSESARDQAVLAYEQANAQLVRATAVLSTAEERLEDTEIRSPIDGVVLTRPVEVGQIISSGTTTVTGGTLLCTIANMSEVYVVADVDETDIGQVKIGQTASISADAYPDKKLTGEVQRIAPQAKVEQNVTMFEVTTVVDNSDGLLKAGMNATVEIVMARADNALLIPARAIEMKPRQPDPSNADTAAQGGQRMAMAGRGGPGNGAIAAEGGGNGQSQGNPNGRRGGRLVPSVQVRRNGIVTPTPIKTGLSNLDQIEVVEGLAEGDTLVYSLASGALQQRAEFRERMSTRGGVPGLRGGG